MRTQSQLLLTVRDVFGGRISPERLRRLSGPEQAYVAVAIMLALPDRYLEEDGRVIGPLSRVLQRVVYAGPPGHPWVLGESIVKAARRAGLYQSSGSQPKDSAITLTPPPELRALVDELGATAAVQRIQKRIDGARLTPNEPRRHEREAAEVIAELRARGGEGLLREIWRQLNSE